MAIIKSLRGHTPQFGNNCFLADNAVVIGEVKMGDNCTIFHGVTIGAKLPFHKEFPTIGSNVYIGTGSTILGDVSIGNDVTIGANSMVLEDIPDNSVVIGNPAKIIRKTK